MPRPLQRARLESGPNLDLNELIRRRIIVPGYRSEFPHSMSWTNNYTGDQIAIVQLSYNLEGIAVGWLKIEIDGRDQWIELSARERHFGGRQWYFLCPHTYRRVSTLWMPPGASSFASRQYWGRQVAYASQFLEPIQRAHRGKAKINSELCAVGGFDPKEWDFCPKPKWMRWRTYNKAEEKFDRYEAMLNKGLTDVVLRCLGHK
jgi:hypothetical protein